MDFLVQWHLRLLRWEILDLLRLLLLLLLEHGVLHVGCEHMLHSIEIHELLLLLLRWI